MVSRVRKTIVNANDNKAPEDGVLIPLGTIVDAYGKAPGEGRNRVPYPSEETVDGACNRVPEGRALIPLDTVVDAYRSAREEDPNRVPNPSLESIDSTCDKVPEDRALNPLDTVVDAHDSAQEEDQNRVQNPLKAVDDAYNKAPEEDRKRIRVILVMGLTGTGKSTFIKKLTNDHKIAIGDDLHSQTAEISLSEMNFRASNNQSYDVFLADTPGFDDSTRSDTDVLKNIVYWLGAMRERRIKLSGIIYLHRITDTRVGGLAWRNLRMLHNLVGADKMANVLLVSTRWEEQPLAEPDVWRAMMEKRQKQLEQGYVDRTGKVQQGFWQLYIQNGARVMRHDDSIDSARRIVDNIIICSTPIYIQIQDEVHAGKGLSQTAAGQAIKTDLEKAAEKTKEELSRLKVEMEDALKNAKEDKDRLQQQYEERIASLGQRMATESEDQRRRTQQELANLKAQMDGDLKNEKEQQDRLRQQYAEEVSFMRKAILDNAEKQRQLLQASHEKLEREIQRRSRPGITCSIL